jgi:hypothetical protein
MSRTRKAILETFSAELRARLRHRYRGHLPSAATVAAHFNLQLLDPTLQVSQETVRRWIRGVSFPDTERTSVLAGWLGLDLHRALLCGDREAPQRRSSDLADELITMIKNVPSEKRLILVEWLRLIAPQSG